MNLEKYNHTFLVEVKGIYKDITRWDEEEGELSNLWSTECDYIKGKANFDSLAIQNSKQVRRFIEEVIKDGLCISKLDVESLYIRDYDCQGGNAGLSISTVENANGYIFEGKAWEESYRRNKEELYYCDYVLSIKINGVDIWGNDLKEIFDNVCVY